MKPIVSGALLASIVLASMGITVTASQAVDSNTAPVTAQSVFENNQPSASTAMAEVVITSKDGVQLYEATVGESLYELLKEKGFSPDSLHLANATLLTKDITLTGDAPLYLFQTKYKGKVKAITIPYPTVTKKTTDLTVGVKRVKRKGVTGKGLITTVSKENLATDSAHNNDGKLSQAKINTEETLTVIRAPIARVIMIGTRQRVAPRVRTSSVVAQSPARSFTKSSKAKNHPEVHNALAQVGKSYAWGAAGPNSFDCSGLVYWSFTQAGWNIPRTTSGGYGNMGKAVTWAGIQPGDLIWNYSHIAIYVGNGRVVEAANSRVGVVNSPASYLQNKGFKVARLSK